MIEFFKKIFTTPAERPPKPPALPLRDDEIVKGLELLHKQIHGLENVFASRGFRKGSEIVINKRVSMLAAANDDTYTHYRIYVDDIAVLMLCGSLGGQTDDRLSVYVIGASPADAEVFWPGKVLMGTPSSFKMMPKEFQVVLSAILRALIVDSEKAAPKSPAVQKLTSITYSDVA